MTIYSDEETALSGSVDTSQGYSPQTGFVENFNAAVDAADKTGSLLSKTNNLTTQYDKIISIAKSSNPEFNLDNPMYDYNTPSYSEGDLTPNTDIKTTEQRIQEFHNNLNLYFEKDMGLSEFLKLKDLDTLNGVLRNANSTATDSLRVASDVDNRSTLFGKAGQFAGGAWGVVTDPIYGPAMALTAPLSVPYSLAARTFLGASLKVAMNEAIYNGIANGTITAANSKYLTELGVLGESGVDQRANLALGIGEGALIGGTIGGGLYAAGRAIPKIPYGLVKTYEAGSELSIYAKNKLNRLPLDKVQTLYDDLLKTVPNIESKDVFDLKKSYERSVDDNVLKDTPAGNKEHQTKINEVLKAEVTGKPALIDELPVNQIDTQKVKDRIFTTDYNTELVNPADIKIEPKKFQVKNKVIEPEVKGDVTIEPVVIYEYADGNRSIVDGHGRLGEARKLQASGQKIMMPAHILRETSGITVAEARAIGQLINQRELTQSGKGSLLNNIPGIAKLSDNAFDMVVKRTVDENIASRVGNNFSNKDLHAPIIQYIQSKNFKSVLEIDRAINDIKNIGNNKSVKNLKSFITEMEKLPIAEKAKLLDEVIKDINTTKGEGTINAEKINELSSKQGEFSNDINNATNKYKSGDVAGAKSDIVAAIDRANRRGEFKSNTNSGSAAIDEIKTSLSEVPGKSAIDSTIDKRFSDIKNNPKVLTDKIADLNRELFGDNAKPSEKALTEDVVIIKELGFDENGNIIEAKTKLETVKEMLNREAMDEKMLQRLSDCQ
jgi:hypothetical protein